MLWAEYGPTRPPLETRFCLDGEGINGRMTGRADLVLSPPDQLPTFPSSSLQLDVGHVSAYEAALSLSSSASAECFTSLMRFTRGRARVILVVGQLADDSSLISFGRGWTPTLVLREALERLTSPDTVFILRPHPAEAASFHNFAAGQSLRAEVDGRDDVMIIEELGDAAYAACIAVASEVVAVNSSVCFEAMLLGKPIRVLGSASYMPASDDAKFPMHARQLDCASIDVLLTKRFIVGSEFWTKAFWKSRAAAVMQHASFPAMLPRLPNAHARILGRCHDAGDGILGVDGIGPLPLHAPVGEAGGSFDQLSLVSHSLQMRGWALDPRTGGIPAGFIFTTGEHSIWSSALHARSDVARHLESPKALMAGFGINVSLSDMPSASHLPVRAYAVAVTGDCTPIDKVWWLDPAEGNFVRVSDST
ncbi:MAG: hypothetical protein EON55_06630 [Alphaproteobacteria bacterium]|nr:MAG: hypothetical protein EON55_06630 [Alphaproteobacteria bacterium]